LYDSGMNLRGGRAPFISPFISPVDPMVHKSVLLFK
jgi:hypothetical protein